MQRYILEIRFFKKNNFNIIFRPKFESDFHTKTLYASLISPIHATRPIQHILPDLLTRIIYGQITMFHDADFSTPVTSSLLGPHIFRSIFSQGSSLSATDTVPHLNTLTSTLTHLRNYNSKYKCPDNKWMWVTQKLHESTQDFEGKIWLILVPLLRITQWLWRHGWDKSCIASHNSVTVTSWLRQVLICFA